MPSLVALNVNENFCKDIEVLDNTPSRTCDTCHVFYVKDGQKDFKDILNNVVSPNYKFCFTLLCFYGLIVIGAIWGAWRILAPQIQLKPPLKMFKYYLDINTFHIIL